MSAEPSVEPGDIADPAAESLWARLFAGWFLLAGGLSGLAAPFAVSGGSWAYRSVVLDLDFAAADGSLVVIGVLLLMNRARSLTVGMAVGFTAVSAVRNLDVFRTDFSHLLPAVDYFPLGRFLATVLGGICLTGITRTTRGARRAVPHDQVRGARIAAMVVGAVGGVCWFVGDCLAWNTTTVTPPGGINGEGLPQTTTCCTFSEVDFWSKANILGICAVILALAVAAAAVRSRRRGAGMVLAAAVATLPNVFEAVYLRTSPTNTLPGTTWVTVSLLPGFWITVAGIVILAVAGVLRLAAGRVRPISGPAPQADPAPWPTAPGATPGTAGVTPPAPAAAHPAAPSPAAAALGDSSATG